ncbi:penicillin-binding protein [Thermodesulfobacteriota bacterium]
MKVQDKKWIRFRIYIVAFFFLAGLLTVMARAFQLQVIDRDRLDAIARAGYKGITKLPPKRGTIYDREGHELAVSVEVTSIYTHPKLIKDKDRTAGLLALNLDEEKSSILGLLKKDRSFVWIKRRVSPEKGRQIKNLDLEGIGLTTETRRYYPGRDIAGHLLGFSGSDNQGLEGLEKEYDNILTGPQDSLIQMRDAIGRPFFISRPNNDGKEMHNLTLTIDKDIQYKAQQALEEAVKKAKGKSGQCIILDPDTGEILAMAVAPSFNPNLFGDYQPYQWRNRTITDVYEPGSIIKVFLLATALEKGIVSPNTKFDCEMGEFRVNDKTIHDTKKYGILNVSDIVVKSSNIGAVKIGQEIGYELFRDYLSRFGLGEKTGIDLVGERKGFIRPAKSARLIDRANSYFGQGMTASSIQIAAALGCIANGGKLMQPFIVKKVTDQNGKVIDETRPRMVRRVLSPQTSNKVAQILEGVVTERGTAKQAAIQGYRVAGKTGTSQKVDPVTKRYSKKDYVAIFGGFVPAQDPKLVILVMVDEPRGQYYGGLVAGPVFKDVGTWALNNLNIHPELRLARIKEELLAERAESFESKIEPKSRIENTGTLPDFSGKSMRTVLRDGNTLGFRIVLEGTGLAVNQYPEPGVPLKGITAVKVKFRPPV